MTRPTSTATADGNRLLDELIQTLDRLRAEMIEADDKAMALKMSSEQQEETIRDHRRALDTVRALAAELDVTRATAEKRLAIVETLMVGPRQKLFIVRRDNVEHLVLSGPDGATVIEGGITVQIKTLPKPQGAA